MDDQRETYIPPYARPYTVETNGNGRFLLSRGAAEAIDKAQGSDREAFELANSILVQLGYSESYFRAPEEGRQR